jgi:hypothetical protein
VAGSHDFLVLHTPVTEFFTIVISEKYVDIVIVCLKACYQCPCRGMSDEVPASKLRGSNNPCA